MGNCWRHERNKIDRDVDIDLMMSTYSSTPRFVPNLTIGKVVKVYDGDTVTIVSKLNDELYKWSIRLYGVDTPEMRRSSKEEKSIAILVQKALEKKIKNKLVTMDVKSYDKYGRLLCILFYNDININDWLLDERFAVPYDGKTKKVIDWKQYYNRLK